MGLPFGLPQQAAKAARIGEAHCQTRIQDKVHMVVPSWQEGHWHHPQATRHTQVEDSAPRGQVQQQVFGSAAEAENPLAWEYLPYLLRDWPTQIWTP